MSPVPSLMSFDCKSVLTSVLLLDIIFKSPLLIIGLIVMKLLRSVGSSQTRVFFTIFFQTQIRRQVLVSTKKVKAKKKVIVGDFSISSKPLSLLYAEVSSRRPGNTKLHKMCMKNWKTWGHLVSSF